MQAFFDKQQAILADMLEHSQQNHVGHFADQIFGFAKGGLAGGDSLDTDKTEANDNLLSRIATSAQKSVTGTDSSVLGGKYGDSPLGAGFVNSPAYITQRYSDLGNFFKGGEPGNFYTNRYEQPVKGQSPQSAKPGDFYAQWYEGMRRFAEAKEVADAGQTTVRSR